jgi:hypothetical protein
MGCRIDAFCPTREHRDSRSSEVMAELFGEPKASRRCIPSPYDGDRWPAGELAPKVEALRRAGQVGEARRDGCARQNDDRVGHDALGRAEGATSCLPLPADG